MDDFKIVIIILIIIGMMGTPKIQKIKNTITKHVNPLVLGVILIIIVLLMKDIESFSQENTYMGYLTDLTKNASAVIVAAAGGEPTRLTHSHGKGGPNKHIHPDHTHVINRETVTSTPEPLTPEPEAFSF